MIVYKKVNGRASDLRFVPDGYTLAEGEVELAGDALPALESLHDAAVLEADAKARHNSTVQHEMDMADMKAIRALLDGDTARIAAHKAAQAERRARLLK